MPTKKRKQQSPKLRFEVFKRDSFTCAYCGSEPPAVVLEIDHIDPVASGGSDDIDNLITSCFDCNRGKGHTPLSSIPPSLKESMEVRKEKEAQIKEYRKFMAAIRRRTQRDIKKIEKIYTNKYPEYKFNERFSQVTVKRFLSMLPIHEIEDAMYIACSRPNLNENRTLKYFCGICWQKFDRGRRK